MEKGIRDMIRVLTTLFNAEKYIGLTIESLKAQTITDFKCYITDDMSTDNSVNIALKQINNDPRFEVIVNKEKFYQPGNYWQCIQKTEIDDEDICITLDGDDWLPDNKTLERVLSYYQNSNIWMSFGQFMYYRSPGVYDIGFSKRPDGDVRYRLWQSTHLRTFKAWLFRRVKKEDLIGPNNVFFEVTGDMVCFIPMIEMAGMRRIIYTDDINYIYNVETQLNDFKVNGQLQTQYDQIVRSKIPYAKLLNK